MVRDLLLSTSMMMKEEAKIQGNLRLMKVHFKRNLNQEKAQKKSKLSPKEVQMMRVLSSKRASMKRQARKQNNQERKL